ncbi:MAG: alpha/beta hydrolase [Proteobacteria bacterium]|nr:alpha/beta hydrolase [Pseudomonadota bacterium]HQR04858.1 alpha/beta hydrolase [Rhodocyclaceae bacterium]
MKRHPALSPRRWPRWLLPVFGLLLVAVTAVLAATWWEARKLLHNPPASRSVSTRTPADFGLPYRDVTLTSADGLRLVAWYVPGPVANGNGALIVAQHGYKSQRSEMLEEGAMLYRRGYALLIPALRAHGRSEGEWITFGLKEADDLEGWVRYARTLPEGRHIGLLGNSFGAVLAIECAARDPGVGAVVAHSPFSSLADTINISVPYFTGLPAFPFANLIRFWAERRLGVRADQIDAKSAIGRISPRPVMILQGGADITVAPDSGQRLYDAAQDPKVLWYEPALGHTEFDTALPAEFARRVGDFFDHALLSPRVVAKTP